MAKDFISGLEEKALKGEGISYEEGCLLVNLLDEEVFSLLSPADRIRRAFKGNEVNLCSIVNAKSGLCPEDCTFCAQSIHYTTGIKTYPMLDAHRIIGVAKDAVGYGAREFSIVTSGRGVSKKEDVETLMKAIRGIGEETHLERCASLGILSREVLLTLKEAGLQSYHHNLETARSFFKNVCTTHDYEEDVNIVKMAKELGFYVCCGGVFGLGETRCQRVELAVTLRELDVDSIPINFLNPRPGTPLEGANYLTPIECLKTIVLYRFMLPTKDIIICGGRQVNLRDMQCLIFAAGANGVMIGNYLTTMGRPPEEDLQMIRDMGLRPRTGERGKR